MLGITEGEPDESPALRQSEGTRAARRGADQQMHRRENQAFQGDCAGSIPVTRSTGVSRDTVSQVSRDTVYVRAFCGAAMNSILSGG